MLSLPKHKKNTQNAYKLQEKTVKKKKNMLSTRDLSMELINTVLLKLPYASMVFLSQHLMDRRSMTL